SPSILLFLHRQRGIVKFMSTRFLPLLEQQVVCHGFHFPVPQRRQSVIHPDHGRDHARHRMFLPFPIHDRLGQVHVSATLGICRHASSDVFPERTFHFLICG